MSYYLKAQDYPFGKSKEMVRKVITSNFPFMKLSQNDICDTFSFPKGVSIIYYYRDNKCYMMKQVYPSEFEQIYKEMSDGSYKKVRENVWTDLGGTVMIDLIVIKAKNQCIFEYRPVEKRE